MNSYYDNIEIEPLSLEEPIDWYYDKVAENGYATECVFLIFSEYVRRHKLSLKICGISFDDLMPEMESESLRLEIIEAAPTQTMRKSNCMAVLKCHQFVA